MFRRQFASARFRNEDDGDGGAGGTTAGTNPDVQAAAEALAAKMVEQQVGGLKAKRDELLGEVKRLKGRAGMLPDDFDPEEYKALKSAAAKAEEERLRKEGDFDKWRQQMQDERDRLLGEAQAERDKAFSQRDSYVQRTEVIANIAKADGIADLLEPHVMAQTKVFVTDNGPVVKVVDKEGHPRINGQTGKELTLADLLSEMKESDVFAPAFRGSRATGGGANGSAGNGGASKTVNPWKADSRNLTMQGQILRENPELAARLKAEASA